MAKLNFVRKNSIAIIVAAIGLVFLIILANNLPVYSQSNTSLNADISSLRSRINRLESEVRFLQRSRSNIPVSPDDTEQESINSEFNNPPVVEGQAIGKSDPLFERLATLIIELKEDVRNIETRLAALEEQNLSNQQ